MNVIRSDTEPGKIIGVAFVEHPVTIHADCEVKVTGAPPGADVTLDVFQPVEPNTFVFSKPGRWTLSTHGRSFGLAVFPYQALNHPAVRLLHHDPPHIIGAERPRAQRELILLALARHPAFTLDGLTPAHCIPAVDLKDFGG
jgi:hypothetical protein